MNENIIVSVGANTSGLESGMARAQASISGMANASNALSERMKQAFETQRQALEPLKMQMAELNDKMLDMTLSASNFTGTNAEFVNGLHEMGLAHKQLADQMLANNTMALMSFYDMVGGILARSGQSEKIAQNFERMGNPLYTVNNGLLKVTGGLEGMARAGQPAVLALKMLGPTANMKDLATMTNMITQGLNRYTAVAIASGIATVLMVGALHKGAMENEKYKSSFETMLSKVREAFQPMVDVFASVMTKVYDFITVVAELIIKFNEAHPFLAKMIQGFLMLVVVLTFILAPLAIGIGLLGGMQAAFALIWGVIGPLITGLGAMMGTVMLVAGAIVGLVAVGVLLYKNWDKITAWLKSAWESIKTTAVNIWEGLKMYFMTLFMVIVSKVTSFVSQLLLAIKTKWEEIKAVTSAVWDAVKQALETAWNNILTNVENAWNWIKEAFNTGVEAVKGVASALLDFFLTWTPLGMVITTIKENWNEIVEFFKISGEMLKAVWQLIWQTISDFLAPIIDGIKNKITQAWDWIKAVTSIAFEIVKNTLNAVWITIRDAITTAVSAIVDFVKQRWENLKNNVITVFNFVKDKITEVWNAIKAFLEPIVKAIVDAVMSKWNALKDKMSDILSSIKNTVTNAWNNVVDTTKSIYNNVKDYVTTTFNNIKDNISNTVSSIADKVRDAFNRAKDAMTKPIDDAKAWLKSAVDNIVGMFANMKISIPKPKIPRINVTTGHKNVAGVDIPYPKIDVDWYAKGGIFNGASIIGVGERGSEAVVPLQGHRMKPFAEAIAGEMGGNVGGGGNGVSIQVGQLIVREEADVKRVAEELYRMQTRASRTGGR